MRACIPFSLVVAIVLAPPTADAEIVGTAPIRLVVAGPDSVAMRIEDALRGLWASAEPPVSISRQSTLRREEALAHDTDTAPASAYGWIALSPREVEIIVASARRDRFILRRVDSSDGYTDLALEQIGQATRAAVTAVLEGEEPALSREEAETLWLPPTCPQADPPLTQQAKPELLPMRASRLAAGVSYSAQAYDTGRWLQGLSLQASWRMLTPRHPEISLAMQYLQSREEAIGFARIAYHTVSMQLGASASAWQIGGGELRLALGLGATRLSSSLRPWQSDQLFGMEITGNASVTTATARASLGWRQDLGAEVSIALWMVLDASLRQPSFVLYRGYVAQPYVRDPVSVRTEALSRFWPGAAFEVSWAGL